MSEYHAGLAPAPVPPPRDARLGRILVLDLVLLLLAVLLISVALPIPFLIGRLLQEGRSLESLGSLNEGELIRLLGVEGIVTLLLVQNLLFIGWPLIRVRWLRREPLANLGLRFERPLYLIGFGLGLGIATLILNAALGALFVALGVRQNQSDQYPLFAGDYLGQLFFLLGAAVVVPLGEEILFRGYVFGTLLRSWSGRRWGTAGAYVLSALIFSLVHSLAATQGVIALLVPTFVMGLVLAWALHRTGSLVPSIIAHAFNNGIALLALLAYVNGYIPRPDL
jgi:membrane protease YdiL (CAAX protease family)